MSCPHPGPGDEICKNDRDDHWQHYGLNTDVFRIIRWETEKPPEPPKPSGYIGPASGRGNKGVSNERLLERAGAVVAPSRSKIGHPAAADAERSAARERVAQPVPQEVKDRYLAAIRMCAEGMPSFIVDDCWEALEGDPWEERRFMGNMLTEASKIGLIEKGGWAESKTAWRTNHPVREWVSMVYDGPS